MAGPSLHDSYVRLDGARKDIEALNDQVGRFLREQVYSVVNDEDPELHERLLGIRIARPPADWGRKAGHVVNDLRSALDYLVYQLAWLDSGTRQNGTQFLICDTPEAFTAELKKKRLRGLSPSHVQAIEACQPYRNPYWIRQVRVLSNPDKHRYLHSVVSENWPPVANINAVVEVRPQEKPHRLMNVARLVGVGLPLASELNVQMNVSVGVAFSDGSPVIETLQILEAGVRCLIDPFQAEF